ncbi:LytTR family transcriptional regulator DNA-binding domain-containing protein [Spirosoma gilvum]
MKQLAAANFQHTFDPTHVLYLTGDVNYSSVYLLDGKVICTSRTLKWHHERWPQFLRIHKASLINPHYIHHCQVFSSILAQLTMKNGAVLPVGRRRIGEVLAYLGHPSRSAGVYVLEANRPAQQQVA